jgi:predicted membrane protein
MELGGMNITDMNLSNGLSSTELNFSEPVKKAVQELELETGLGKFRAKNLGNAKFEELSFDCGLGSATLDFHGESAERSEVSVDVGLGSVTLILPEKLGVRIEAEKSFLSGLSLDSDFRQKDGYYYTENWNSAEKRMHIELSVGLGSISVERIE